MLTEVDRLANGLADSLAKEEALSVRVPRDIRQRVKEEHEAVRSAAILVGKPTCAANHQEAGEGEPKRDSCPRVHDGRRRRGGGGARGQADRPPQLGGHSITAVGERWLCVVCRRMSAKRCALSGRRCRGSAAENWALPAQRAADAEHGKRHNMDATGKVIWCLVCGSYADRWAVRLARSCPGPPSKSACRRTALNRLRQGRHAVSGEKLAGHPQLEH